MRRSRLSRRAFLGSVGASVLAGTAGILAACTTLTGGSASSPSPAGVVADSGSRRRWPGEWERHDATLMSMPFQRAIYGGRLPDVQREWAGAAATIARYEPVTVVIPPGSGAEMRRLVGPGVDLVEIEYEDGWLRDNGPIFVIDDGGVVTGLDWMFNGWGGAFDAFGYEWRGDDRLPPPLLEHLGIAREAVPMVLEGGAVLSDGNGMILTTEECLLNPDRNPSMDRGQIESSLLRHLGARSVVWLPFGLIGDRTSGHVDGVAAMVGPGRVIAQTDPANAEEQARLAENLSVLRASTDADGRPLDVVEFPVLPRGSFAGLPESSFTYLNVGFARDALVVQVTGDEALDREGLGMLGEIVTDREIVPVAAPTINWAGGGVHCITQQLPVAE